MRNARHLVSIEHKTREADDFDGKPEAWEMFAKAWCNIRPLRGDELLQAQQVHEKVTHRVTTVWQDGITSEMRIDLNGRKLNIVSAINQFERYRDLEMMCIEVT